MDTLSFGRNLSYWPFIEILRQLLNIGEDDSETQSWDKLEQHSKDLFGVHAPEVIPYLATVLSLSIRSEYEERVKYLDPQALGRQIFLCMRQLFERLTEQEPVLLIMEDWHWVDQSSIALCEHLLPLALNRNWSTGWATSFW